jgi:hypothetical protein
MKVRNSSDCVSASDASDDIGVLLTASVLYQIDNASSVVWCYRGGQSTVALMYPALTGKIVTYKA